MDVVQTHAGKNWDEAKTVPARMSICEWTYGYLGRRQRHQAEWFNTNARCQELGCNCQTGSWLIGQPVLEQIMVIYFVVRNTAHFQCIGVMVQMYANER
jgi:hypothetical protein